MIATDLKMVSYLPKMASTTINKKDDKTYKPRFFSKDFIEDHPDPKMDEHRLDEKKLKEYGIIVTNIRRELEDAA